MVQVCGHEQPACMDNTIPIVLFFFSGVGHCHTGFRGDWQVETAHALLKSVAHAWMQSAGAAESATQAMEAFLQQALPLVGAAVELLARGDVRSVCHALLAMID